MYAYARNNPTTLTDPLGLGPCVGSIGGGTFPCPGSPVMPGCDPIDVDPSCDPIDIGGNPPFPPPTGDGESGGTWGVLRWARAPSAATTEWNYPRSTPGVASPASLEIVSLNRKAGLLVTSKHGSGQFWMFAVVAWPFLGPPSDPGMRALGRLQYVGNRGEPWAPVAWYGGRRRSP